MIRRLEQVFFIIHFFCSHDLLFIYKITQNDLLILQNIFSFSLTISSIKELSVRLLQFGVCNINNN